MNKKLLEQRAEKYVGDYPIPYSLYEKIECKNAYKFLSTALAEYLPQNLELEESSVMYGDNEGYFFSCSDVDSDDHYYLLLRYAVI